MMDGEHMCPMHDTIEKAIEMHQMHMENPESATPESQKQLMNMLQMHQKGMMMDEADGESHESDPYQRSNMMTAPKKSTKQMTQY